MDNETGGTMQGSAQFYEQLALYELDEADTFGGLERSATRIAKAQVYATLAHAAAVIEVGYVA